MNENTEIEPTAKWAAILILCSFLFPLIGAVVGAGIYSSKYGNGGSIVIFPPFLLGALAGAMIGCAPGLCAVLISLAGKGWRIGSFYLAILLHSFGTIFAIRVFLTK
jgi:hypothetical protein